MFHIYILYSPSSDRYYVGYSSNVGARFKDHNEGDRPRQSTKYTYKHRPWQLMASFPVSSTRSGAMKFERFIKRQKSRIYIEKLIQSKDNHASLAQLLRVPLSGINR